MGKRKQNNKSFIKVAKQVREDFAKKEIYLTWNQAQKWTSENLYGEFRGTPANRIAKKRIDDSFNKKFKEVGKREILTVTSKQISPYVDVRMVDPNIYEAQAWWELQNVVEKLPAMAQVRIYAGTMGVTPIQVAGDYNSQDLKDMIERIREEIDNISGETFEGYVKVKPNRQDDNNPESYFIDLVFSTALTGSIIEEPTIDVGKAMPPDYSKMGVEEIKKAEKRRERQAQKRQKKQKAKTRKRPSSVQKKKSPAELIRLLELLKQDYKDDIYTKAEYKKERQKLIDKFEKGGEI